MGAGQPNSGRWGGLLGLKKQKFVFLSLALFGVTPGGRRDHTKRFIAHSEFLSAKAKFNMASQEEKSSVEIHGNFDSNFFRLNHSWEIDEIWHISSLGENLEPFFFFAREMCLVAKLLLSKPKV